MSFDRRAAAAVWCLAVAALVASAAASDVDEPEATVRHDPAAYRALVALLDESERGAWLVDAVFTRTPHAGEPSSATTREARRGGVHVLRLPSSATAEVGEVTIACSVAGDEVACIESPPTDRLRTSEALAVLVDEGVYVVDELGREDIAGERARCFRVFGRRGFEPSFGIERQYCFAADGVPLRVRIVDANTTDERVAVAVRRDPSQDDVEDLLRDLEPAASAGGE